MENYNMDSVALAKLRWPETCILRQQFYHIFYSGLKICKHWYGTGFAVKNKIVKAVIKYEPINDRICYLRRGKFSTLLSIYAPNWRKRLILQYVGTWVWNSLVVWQKDGIRRCKYLSRKGRNLEKVNGKHSLHGISNDSGTQLLLLDAIWK